MILSAGWLLFGNFTNATTQNATTPEIPEIATGGKILPIATPNPQKFVLAILLPEISNQFVIVIFAFSAIFIVIAGIIFIIGSGEQEMNKKAKDILVWTILGLALAVVSWGIVKFLTQIDFNLT